MPIHFGQNLAKFTSLEQKLTKVINAAKVPNAVEWRLLANIDKVLLVSERSVVCSASTTACLRFIYQTIYWFVFHWIWFLLHDRIMLMWGFLTSFCDTMLCKCNLCHHAVSICLSARLSRAYILSKWVIVSSNFSPLGSQTILVFHTKRLGNIPTGTLLMGDQMQVGWSNAGEPISGSIACCERLKLQVQYTQLRGTMASWWH